MRRNCARAASLNQCTAVYICKYVHTSRHTSRHLHEDRGAEVLVGVPPVRRARGAAAGAQDALVHAVELLAVLYGLCVCVCGIH